MATYEWDEAKRLGNAAKHGVDFLDADLVFESPFKVSVDVTRDSEKEKRYADFAEVKGVVLKLVYTLRGDKIRCISLRVASRSERRSYEKAKNCQVLK
ncbi:MAG: BrnT family toxin [Deltaproteobacteria bacterium]|nr:BrnT family toxin [Deltaproteobacteria bacterium]